MARNLNHLGGLALSEMIMLELGRHLGRQEAHHVVYECAMAAITSGTPFLDVLRESPVLKQHLDEAQLSRLLDPAAYAGYSRQFVEDVMGPVAD